MTSDGPEGQAGTSPATAPEASRPFVPRVLPVVDDSNRYFWTAGATGRLQFLRCRQCGRYAHPPGPTCRACRSTELEPTPVSGRGTVLSYTVNRQAWTPEATEPYVVAIVGMDEQDDLHVTTNIVGCRPDEVSIGMSVEVEFLPLGEVWLPLFRPAADHRPGGPGVSGCSPPGPATC